LHVVFEEVAKDSFEFQSVVQAKRIIDETKACFSAYKKEFIERKTELQNQGPKDAEAIQQLKDNYKDTKQDWIAFKKKVRKDKWEVRRKERDARQALRKGGG
jgi:hypothetical protein